MSNHIGIVGVSPEGLALFYRTMSRHASRLRGPHEQARLTVHNEPLHSYIECIRKDDWHGVGKLLRRSAEILARCGAGFCLTPDNVVQHGVQLAEVGSPIPWLTIPDLVGAALAKDQRRVVGVLGTKLVMRSSSYQTHLGLKGVRTLAPSEQDAELVDRIIFDELIYGGCRHESQAVLYRVVGEYAKRGCDAIVLASSELPLVLSESSCPLPLYDSTEVLAEAAVQRAKPG
jgi:aspartate racemase